jgi:hypothetical protein
MVKKNSIIAGIAIALIFPAIAFGMAYLLRNQVYIIGRPAIPYLVAIAFNLILIRLLQKKDMDQTSRGIMLATFVIMLLVVLTKVYHVR